MAVCTCCQNLFHELQQHFCNGNDDKFYELWSNLVQKPEIGSPDPNNDLSLLVHFKLRVYFAVVQPCANDTDRKTASMERLSSFLQEDGSTVVKFPELAPYYALPYIKETSHPLLDDIRKDEWANELQTQWTELLRRSVHHTHGFDEVKIERQKFNYARLKTKFSKLKEDHKMLLGHLATRLVTTLEDCLRGSTNCALETFEYYNQEVKTFSDNNNIAEEEIKTENITTESNFQWQASNTMKKSISTESIDSKTSFE